MTTFKNYDHFFYVLYSRMSSSSSSSQLVPIFDINNHVPYLLPMGNRMPHRLTFLFSSRFPETPRHDESLVFGADDNFAIYQPYHHDHLPDKNKPSLHTADLNKTISYFLHMDRNRMKLDEQHSTMLYPRAEYHRWEPTSEQERRDFMFEFENFNAFKPTEFCEAQLLIPMAQRLYMKPLTTNLWLDDLELPEERDHAVKYFGDSLYGYVQCDTSRETYELMLQGHKHIPSCAKTSAPTASTSSESKRESKQHIYDRLSPFGVFGVRINCLSPILLFSDLFKKSDKTLKQRKENLASAAAAAAKPKPKRRRSAVVEDDPEEEETEVVDDDEEQEDEHGAPKKSKRNVSSASSSDIILCHIFNVCFSYYLHENKRLFEQQVDTRSYRFPGLSDEECIQSFPYRHSHPAYIFALTNGGDINNGSSLAHEPVGEIFKTPEQTSVFARKHLFYRFLRAVVRSLVYFNPDVFGSQGSHPISSASQFCNKFAKNLVSVMFATRFKQHPLYAPVPESRSERSDRLLSFGISETQEQKDEYRAAPASHPWVGANAPRAPHFVCVGRIMDAMRAHIDVEFDGHPSTRESHPLYSFCDEEPKNYALSGNTGNEAMRHLTLAVSQKEKMQNARRNLNAIHEKNKAAEAKRKAELKAAKAKKRRVEPIVDISSSSSSTSSSSMDAEVEEVTDSRLDQIAKHIVKHRKPCREAKAKRKQERQIALNAQQHQQLLSLPRSRSSKDEMDVVEVEEAMTSDDEDENGIQKCKCKKELDMHAIALFGYKSNRFQRLDMDKNRLIEFFSHNLVQPNTPILELTEEDMTAFDNKVFFTQHRSVVRHRQDRIAYALSFFMSQKMLLALDTALNNFEKGCRPYIAKELRAMPAAFDPICVPYCHFFTASWLMLADEQHVQLPYNDVCYLKFQPLLSMVRQGRNHAMTADGKFTVDFLAKPFDPDRASFLSVSRQLQLRHAADRIVAVVPKAQTRTQPVTFRRPLKDLHDLLEKEEKGFEPLLTEKLYDLLCIVCDVEDDVYATFFFFVLNTMQYNNLKRPSAATDETNTFSLPYGVYEYMMKCIDTLQAMSWNRRHYLEQQRDLLSEMLPYKVSAAPGAYMPIPPKVLKIEQAPAPASPSTSMQQLSVHDSDESSSSPSTARRQQPIRAARQAIAGTIDDDNRDSSCANSDVEEALEPNKKKNKKLSRKKKRLQIAMKFADDSTKKKLMRKHLTNDYDEDSEFEPPSSASDASDGDNSEEVSDNDDDDKERQAREDERPVLDDPYGHLIKIENDAPLILSHSAHRVVFGIVQPNVKLTLPIEYLLDPMNKIKSSLKILWVELEKATEPDEKFKNLFEYPQYASTVLSTLQADRRNEVDALRELWDLNSKKAAVFRRLLFPIASLVNMLKAILFAQISESAELWTVADQRTVVLRSYINVGRRDLGFVMDRIVEAALFVFALYTNKLMHLMAIVHKKIDDLKESMHMEIRELRRVTAELSQVVVGSEQANQLNQRLEEVEQHMEEYRSTCSIWKSASFFGFDEKYKNQLRFVKPETERCVIALMLAMHQRYSEPVRAACMLEEFKQPLVVARPSSFLQVWQHPFHRTKDALQRTFKNKALFMSLAKTPLDYVRADPIARVVVSTLAFALRKLEEEGFASRATQALRPFMESRCLPADLTRSEPDREPELLAMIAQADAYTDFLFSDMKNHVLRLSLRSRGRAPTAIEERKELIELFIKAWTTTSEAHKDNMRIVIDQGKYGEQCHKWLGSKAPTNDDYSRERVVDFLRKRVDLSRPTAHERQTMRPVISLNASAAPPQLLLQSATVGVVDSLFPSAHSRVLEGEVFDLEDRIESSQSSLSPSVPEKPATVVSNAPADAYIVQLFSNAVNFGSTKGLNSSSCRENAVVSDDDRMKLMFPNGR
jgi:hypothetical protein